MKIERTEYRSEKRTNVWCGKRTGINHDYKGTPTEGHEDGFRTVETPCTKCTRRRVDFYKK